jgi:lipid II:glycine glycyltransferase (peptidoglycan interpeptide bridge formation enzyme)
VTHELALESDARAVFRRFRPSQVQRNIRRAEREGVQIRRADSRRDVSELFYALHVTTRRRQGVPVQPRRFFALLWDLVIDRGLGFVSLAHKHGRTVAGAVFLVWNKTIIYKYGASDAGYWSLRPNHLIFWDAIEWACENDMQTFDLGRTDFENEGLRRFKSGWGATESPLVYATIGEAPRDGSRRHATALMRPVLTHGPPWLCRAIGALLYRYAGS